MFGGSFRAMVDISFLAIAVLVLTLMTFVQKVNQAQSNTLEFEAIADELEIEAAHWHDVAGGLGQEVQKLKAGHEIQLVTAIDTSASMSEPIENLKRGLLELAELLTLVAKVEIGVVLYRDRGTRVLQLREVLPHHKDNGLSLKALTDELESIVPASAYSNTEDGVGEALKMLDQASSSDARQIFALLSDVGPGEWEYHTPNDGKRLIDTVHRWASVQSKDRRVLSLYSGLPDSDQRTFFQSLADCEYGWFCEEGSQLFTKSFEAAFALPKE